MARFNKIQNTFASGEISQQLNARTEIKEYEQGLHTLLNMITLRGGGATKREGFFYGREIGQYPYVNVSLMEYTPIGQNILLAMRSFNGQTPYPDAPLLAFNLGQFDFLDNVAVLTQNLISTTWISYGFYEDNIVIEPRLWNSIHYGNLLIMTHGSGLVPPIVLSWDGVGKYVKMNRFCYIGIDQSTSILNITGDPGSFTAPGLRIPFQGFNTNTGNTMASSVVTPLGSATTVTSNNPIFSGYRQSMPGGSPYNIQPFYLYMESTGGKFLFIYIKTYLSTTQMGGIVVGLTSGWAANETTTKYSFSYWGGNLGWPKTVSVFQDRLIFGGSPAFPDMVWCSSAGNIFHMNSRRFLDTIDLSNSPNYLGFKGAYADSDPFDMAIASDKISSIQWMANNRDLIVGTFDSEYAVGNVDTFFSNTNSFIRVVSNKGGSNTKVANAETDTIFVSSNGKYLITVTPGEANFSIMNISTLSEDIISKTQQDLTPGNTTTMSAIKIKLITWDKGRNVLWIITTTNDLVGFTLSRDSGIVAFHRHKVEGITGIIESIESTTNSHADGSFLWMAVSNGGDVSLYYMPQYSNYTQMNNQSEREEDKPIFMDGMFVTIGPDNGVSTYIEGTNIQIGSSASYLSMRREDWVKIRKGHPIRFESASGVASLSLPAPIVVDTTYYAIPVSGDIFIPAGSDAYIRNPSIRLATTEANALAGTFITFTAVPAVPLPTPGIPMNALITSGTPAYAYWPTRNLRNKTVGVITDGRYIGQFVVDQYERLHLPGITFTNYMAYGVNYTSILRTMSLNAGSQIGVALESMERIDRVYSLIYASKDGQIGGTDGIFDDIEFDMTNSPTLLETRNIITLMPNSPDVDTHVQIQSSKPLPLTINGLVLRGTQHD